jgi:hypothetical protein
MVERRMARSPTQQKQRKEIFSDFTHSLLFFNVQYTNKVPVFGYENDLHSTADTNGE